LIISRVLETDYSRVLKTTMKAEYENVLNKLAAKSKYIVT